MHVSHAGAHAICGSAEQCVALAAAPHTLRSKQRHKGLAAVTALQHNMHTLCIYISRAAAAACVILYCCNAAMQLV